MRENSRFECLANIRCKKENRADSIKMVVLFHLKTSLLIQSDVRKTSELSGVFLYPCTNFGLQNHISTLEIYKTPLS